MVFLKKGRLAAAAAIVGVVSLGAIHTGKAESLLDRTSLVSTAKVYRLRMHQLHTDETIDVVYRVGNMYIPTALEKLDHFLRDYRTGTVKEYDPREFDTLHALLTKLNKPNGVIDIVCGYRTPQTNEMLRHASAETGVAEHSQHMEGHAIDLRVPGVSTLRLRNAALSLDAGGVGYYPRSQFVHVDVGRVREWSFGGGRHHVRLRQIAYSRRGHSRHRVIHRMGGN